MVVSLVGTMYSLMTLCPSSGSYSPDSDWPACAVDIVERPRDLVQLEREIYMASQWWLKDTQELIETPGPRLESVGPGFVSMMRSASLRYFCPKLVRERDLEDQHHSSKNYEM